MLRNKLGKQVGAQRAAVVGAGAVIAQWGERRAQSFASFAHGGRIQGLAAQELFHCQRALRGGGNPAVGHAQLRNAAVGIALQRKAGGDDADVVGLARSEEHTSELQSLMRISYAVFCLKKKTKITTVIET